MDEQFLENMSSEIENLEKKNYELSTALASTSFQGNENANLIEYQIDTGEILSNVEHYLKAETFKVDEDGNESWVTKDAELALLNDYGVNLILSKLSIYLNKNTFLSFYDEQRINEILGDIGDKLAEEIYYNYEKMGMTTPYKKSRYPTIVLTILHIIESAYRRALRGKTLEGLNSSRIVTQAENLTNRDLFQPQKKRFNLFKPSTW